MCRFLAVWGEYYHARRASGLDEFVWNSGKLFYQHDFGKPPRCARILAQGIRPRGTIPQLLLFRLTWHVPIYQFVYRFIWSTYTIITSPSNLALTSQRHLFILSSRSGQTLIQPFLAQTRALKTTVLDSPSSWTRIYLMDLPMTIAPANDHFCDVKVIEATICMGNYVFGSG